MVSTPSPSEDYAEAGARHLDDAEALFDKGNYDGAVYHTGYAVECALKHWLITTLSVDDTIIKSHDIEALYDDLAWAIAVAGPSGLSAWFGELDGHPILEEHPGRRYWRDHWSKRHAQECIEIARGLVDEVILGPLLDDHEVRLPWR